MKAIAIIGDQKVPDQRRVTADRIGKPYMSHLWQKSGAIGHRQIPVRTIIGSPGDAGSMVLTVKARKTLLRAPCVSLGDSYYTGADAPERRLPTARRRHGSFCASPAASAAVAAAAALAVPFPSRPH